MLPAGWDLARIREHVPGARLLDASEHDVLWVVDVGEHLSLEARTVIDCGGLYLVLADPDDGWWMGQSPTSAASPADTSRSPAIQSRRSAPAGWNSSATAS